MSYLGNYRALCKTNFGRKVFVDTRDRSIAPHLLMEGTWEEWTTDFIRQKVPGTLFFDVGANFGWFSLLAHHYKAKQIIAIEANPEVAELVTQTFAINGMLFGTQNKVLARAALDRSKQDVSLFVDRHYLGSSSAVIDLEKIVGEVEDFSLEYPYERKFQVDSKSVAIDDLKLEVSQEHLFIKIDVEGLEPEVIKGARKTIEGSKSCQLLVEHNAVPNQEMMLNYLEEQGFIMRHLNKVGECQSIKRKDLASVEAGDMLYFFKMPE